jgi:hypothetical protein
MSDKSRDEAAALVKNWHNGYHYLARFSSDDQCATDLIDAIAAALDKREAETLKSERSRLMNFAQKFRKQIIKYAWGPTAREVIDRVIIEIQLAAAAERK